MEGHSGFVSAEAVCGDTEVQNGDCRKHMGASERGGMGDVCLPIRHLPPHTHPRAQELQEVPVFLFQWESFLVQGLGHVGHFLSLHLHES